jgi:DNA-binding NarL/FixJ family response regulator
LNRRDGDVQILLVDDNELFRTGVGRILAGEADLHVIGEMPATDDAIALAQRESPDIVVLDVEMRAAQAEQYLDRLLQASPMSKVVVLTMREEPAMIRRLLAAGIRAYMLKSATRDELLASLRAMAAGSDRTIISVSQSTLRELDAGRAGDQPVRSRGSPLLSARELEVLARLAHGMRNAQIARQLGIAEGTVKRHLTNIYTKLGAASRTDAVSRAVSLNLVSLPGPAGPDARRQARDKSAGEQR